MEKNAFPWRRGACEISKWDFEMDSVTHFIKTCVFHVQETLFEGNSFPMWSLRWPEHTFSRNQELQIQKHESYIGKEHFLGRPCARTICSAQDGGPMKDQPTNHDNNKPVLRGMRFPLCRDQDDHSHVLKPLDLRSGRKRHISRSPTIIIIIKRE